MKIELRSGGSSGRVVLLALLVLVVYLVATNGKKLLDGASRPVVENIGAALGIPREEMKGMSDETLRAAIWYELKTKLGTGAIWATALLVLAGAWGLSAPAAIVMGLGGISAAVGIAKSTGLIKSEPGNGASGGGGGGGWIETGLEYPPGFRWW